MPEAKFRVPQIGSTSQYGEPSVGRLAPALLSDHRIADRSQVLPDRVLHSDVRGRDQIALALRGDVRRARPAPGEVEPALDRGNGRRRLISNDQ